MSFSVFEALYNGKINPWEQRPVRSPERTAIEQQIASERQYFKDNLSPEDYARLQEFETLYNNATSDEEANIYAQGFTLGALLMIEVMNNKPAII